MSDAPPQPAPNTVSSEAPPAWKPEARQWDWKDLFSAPMLAFKPKCMAVSAVTLIALGLWVMLFTVPLGNGGLSIADQLRFKTDSRLWFYAAAWLWSGVGLAIFGLGAGLIATFFKADLLDDEFLSWREAWALFSPRALTAMIVPLFLLILVTAIWGGLWVASLAGSIPFLGTTLYALLWPLAFAAAVFAVLVTIAAALAVFLFPAIVTVRRNGWFDNVVDTIEAVGTKPHLLVGALVLVVVFGQVAANVGSSAINGLRTITETLPGQQLQDTVATAEARRNDWLRPIGALTQYVGLPALIPTPNPQAQYIARDTINSYSGFVVWGPGLIAAVWQTVVVGLLAGYGMNLFVSGGLLTYLWVREDDYWDEEDLKDLDQLAKELEEEAKREANAEPRPATQGTIADPG